VDFPARPDQLGLDGHGLATGSAISAPAQSYTYSALSQLTGNGTASYGYDNAADPTTLGSATQTFNAGGQLATATTSGTTTSYGYNARGDRITATTSGATTSYGYNEANQLTSYTPATGAATTYAYKGDGLLMSETTSGTTTSYAWDTISTVPLMLTAGTTSYLYGPGGLPVESINSSGTPTYFMQDQLGSTRLLTSSTGAVTGTYTFDPWGNITSHTGTATTSMVYAGQYQDPATSFYYVHNRYYDPVTAQFLTIDPAVSQTQTPYIYINDNPVNGKDPDGLARICTVGSDSACPVKIPVDISVSLTLEMPSPCPWAPGVGQIPVGVGQILTTGETNPTADWVGSGDVAGEYIAIPSNALKEFASDLAELNEADENGDLREFASGESMSEALSDLDDLPDVSVMISITKLNISAGLDGEDRKKPRSISSSSKRESLVNLPAARREETCRRTAAEKSAGDPESRSASRLSAQAWGPWTS
jgi:RHS repeat-associated protein